MDGFDVSSSEDGSEDDDAADDATSVTPCMAVEAPQPLQKMTSHFETPNRV